MNEAAFRALVSGETRGAIPTMMRIGLRGLSLGYGTAVAIRNRLFDWGLKRTHDVPVPVVSVGNITTGGTGKTPMVAFLANWFRDHGHTPVILSRGYRSVDGEANDEKLVLDQQCPGVPHLQNPDRVASANIALAEHKAGVLVLDDGFQHRRLGRTIDVVLIDATNPFGYGALLPRGLLREPLSSLTRADFAIVTRADQVSETDRQSIISQLRKSAPELPIGKVAFAPQRLLSSNGETQEFAALTSEKVVAFCGIGNPHGFLQTLQNGGYTVDESHLKTFSDHHHYTESDWEQLIQFARDHQAACLLTTQKDLVKIPKADLGGVPLWAVEIGLNWLSGEAEFLERLQHSPA